LLKKLAAILSIWLGRFAGLDGEPEEDFVEERSAYMSRAVMSNSQIDEVMNHYNVTAFVDGAASPLPSSLEDMGHHVIGDRRLFK
jgi:hypothetical protein